MRCDADLARMERFEADGTVTGVSAWSRAEGQLAVGTRIVLEGASIAWQVRESGRPARLDTFVGASGPIADEARELGIRSSVGCPIVVGGRLWGVIAASTKSDVPFPADTESMIGQFTELVGTAIANAQSQAELAASRARLVATADETRRRIERDLHDGAQQRLVSLALQLRHARRRCRRSSASEGDLSRVVEGLDDLLEELREIGARDPPGDPVRGRPRARARRRSHALSRPGRARGAFRGAAAGAGRGGARTTSSPRCSRTPPSTRTATVVTSTWSAATRCSASSSATTASAAPTRPAAPASSG